MSLLRVCNFAKSLRRRGALDSWTVRGGPEDCCRLCGPGRNGAARRHVSETRLLLQKQNVSYVLPKREDTRKRVLEQSQLLEVLEARIHQLQSDVFLDVQRAKVQVIKAPSSGGGLSGQTAAKRAPKPCRWLEKLSQDKKKKLGLQMEQVAQENIKYRPAAWGTGSDSSSMLQAQSNRVISTAARKTTTKSQGNLRLSDRSPAAVTLPVASTAAAAAAREEKDSKHVFFSQGAQKQTVRDVQSRANVEEEETGFSTEEKPDQQPEKKKVLPNVIIQQNIAATMEAFIYAGKIPSAHSFLLKQHWNKRRNRHLTIDIYNILMRAWAKTGEKYQLARLFLQLGENSMKPNLESYMAALECMARHPKTTKMAVSRCLNQMEEAGLSVDDIFNQCLFQRDERAMVLKAIRLVHPDYEPIIKTTTKECSSLLVQDFYSQRENHNYPKLNFTQEELQERFKQQLSLEHGCDITIDSVEGNRPQTPKIIKMRKLLAVQHEQWQKDLLKALKESKAVLAKCGIKDGSVYPYLCVLEDQEYVDIMLQSLATLPITGEALKFVACDLGQRVYAKFAVRQKIEAGVVEKMENIYNLYTDLLAKDGKTSNVLHREHWLKLEAEHVEGPSLQGQRVSWPHITILEVGTFMVELMINNLKIRSDILYPAVDKKLIPVLYHMYVFRSKQQIGYVKLLPMFSKIQKEAFLAKLTFGCQVMPMTCPPVPWTSAKFGGYVLSTAKMMRSVDGATQHNFLLEKSDNLHAVLDALNQLGHCAWRINKPVLDVIISIFNDKGNEKLGIPPPMSEAPKIPHVDSQDLASAERIQMMNEAYLAKKKSNEMNSLRMDALYKLSIANHMRDKIFWFPQNMDFRGRTYPCPPHFNHLGSDVTRALLVFAEGKPLGPKGLDWLKIHLINLTGLKKRESMQARLKYCNTIMEDILDSADNPLNGRQWWMIAEDPWQALSCCMEIAMAVRSPDPENFISHLPVHQDGSCNGLQHYAALGRDMIGATSVNLMPCDTPQDVYSGVAQQVEEFRARDAKQGVKIAKTLEGFITRKVVKQTVMTVVYGVTQYGGRLQIAKRLKEIDDLPKELVWEASLYLVRMVFLSLKEMFTLTREIQDWLTESARLISKCGHSVEWETPLGLPIIQPYHHPSVQVVKTGLQQISHEIRCDDTKKPHTIKQKNAFPPNFIHSLDSTHMMLTALHCHSAGLTFVSVHDCFWTHAMNVDIMNKICREQFVSLHSQPILDDLSTFLIKKYCTALTSGDKVKRYQEYRRLMQVLENVPQTGDFDLQQVKDSTYFFS